MSSLPTQPNIFHGINQRELEQLWRQHGGLILDVNRTGERRLVAPDGTKSARYNARRKDAPRNLVQFARRAFERHALAQTG